MVVGGRGDGGECLFNFGCGSADEGKLVMIGVGHVIGVLVSGVDGLFGWLTGENLLDVNIVKVHDFKVAVRRWGEII